MVAQMSNQHLSMGHCITNLCDCCDKVTSKSNVRVKGFVLAHHLRVPGHGKEVMEAEAEGSWSHWNHDEKAENEECQHSTCFVLFFFFIPGPQSTEWCCLQLR